MSAASIRTSTPLAEYWVASQDAPLLYRYVRGPEAWQVDFHQGVEAGFMSEALQASVRLADVYDGMDFSPASDAA